MQGTREEVYPECLSPHPFPSLADSLSLLPQLYLWFCARYLRMRALSEDEGYLKVPVIQGLSGIGVYRITEGLLSSTCTFKEAWLLLMKSAS